ncbi:MAG: twin-arginine translocase TatA/TatE family subunit [Ferruginibacter sp.]
MIAQQLTIFLSLFQPEHMIFILIAILLLFGGKKIPELMRGIGKGMREFKDAKDNVKTEIESGMKEPDKDEEIRRLRQQLEQKQVQQ